MTDDTPSLPEDLDDGLAFAYGEGSSPPPAPSVLERVGQVTGSTPKVMLRDEQAGETPMLKPLGPDDRVEAGKYVVHGELGRGGVGAVHRGHDQDLGRDVAMKFLHEKYKGDPTILHRFVEEAQIGGQLQHPGIVPVYDLGMVDGKPFFSMKLVKGQTLAKKLAERESNVSERRTLLGVFEDVCQTLAYAHTRGVVHRDLKPANIMIGSFGEVQVVDWGMGKVMQSGGVADEQLASERLAEVSVIETVRSGGQGTQSVMGSVMGTPAYMPPEQARGDVEAMDERSDVFALGAILCEILTGKPPYVGPADELIGMAAMAKLDDALARLGSCGAEPEMVELATRCLMPAPAARPRSAEVVAKEVHDYLAAVESRVHEARVDAAEARVRTASLKRTQRLGVGLLSVFAAGLLASLWFWQAAKSATEREALARAEAVASAQEARDNEQRANLQAEIAERELARAVEIKSLITDMLYTIDPERARGADITLLKEILDTASKRLDEGAIEDELIAAELHYLVGRVYRSISILPSAEAHLLASNEISERILGAEEPRRLRALHSLARVYSNLGAYDKAEPRFLEVLELRERVQGPDHPETLGTGISVAQLYRAQGRYSEAESLYLDYLERHKRVLGEEHLQTLDAMNSLGSNYNFQARYDEAEAILSRTLEIRERVHGEDSLKNLVVMAGLCSAYEGLLRFEEAEVLALRVTKDMGRLLGEDHPDTLTHRNNLVVLYNSMDREAEAEALGLEVLEAQKRVLGAEHPDSLRSMHNLGSIYRKQGRLAEAESIYSETLDARKRVLGMDHLETLSSMSNLADVYLALGRLAEAEALSLRAVEATERAVGSEHPAALSARTILASILVGQGRFEEAESLLREVLEVQLRVLGEEHTVTQTTTDKLVLAYLGQGRLKEVEELLVPQLEFQRRTLGAEHERTLGSTTNLGLLYVRTRRFEEAVEVLESSLPITRRVLGLGHPWTGHAMNGLMTSYAELGRTEEADSLRRELFELQVAAADDLRASAQQLNQVAWMLLTAPDAQMRDPERALVYAKRACALAEESSAGDLWALLDTLALAHFKTGDVPAAIEAQRRAIDESPPNGDPSLTERLAEYEAALRGE